MTFNHWRNLLTFTAGGWLMLSPWVMRYHEQSGAAWSALIIGALLVTSEFIAFVRPGVWEELLDLLLGGYLIASPYLLGFSGSVAAANNAGMVGTVIILLAIIGLFDESEAQLWWRDHMQHH